MAALYRMRWVGRMCEPSCMCGWVGERFSTLKAAKDHFRAHLADDCPIGSRNNPS